LIKIHFYKDSTSNISITSKKIAEFKKAGKVETAPGS